MIRLFADAKYDFIGKHRLAYILSAVFVIPGLLLLLIRGPNYSIEFTGGTLIQIETADTVEAADLRDALNAAGIRGSEISELGGKGTQREFQIRARLAAEQEQSEAAAQATTQAVANALDTSLGKEHYRITVTEAVGPKVGRELQGKALIAILVSFAGTLIYVAFRFEWRFGVAAVLGTAHDLLATLAFISYLKLEVSLVLVAAILTVKGYSLNDKIVIADRVRENLRKYRRQNLYEILNLSVNETLPRTILTGGTTLATTIVLSFLAGEVIRPFALVMSFGIVVGTLSSQFIAPHILLWIERRWPGEDARGVRALAGPRDTSVVPPTPAPSAKPPQVRKPQPAR
jgi:preprotein translocase subunit SecF